MIFQGCRQRNRLLAYYEGDLPRGLRSEVEAHLRECGQCRHLLRKLQETDTLLLSSRPRPEPLPPAVSQAILQEALAQSGVRSPRRTWGMWTFAASLGCLLAFGTTGMLHAPPSPQREPMAITAAVRPAPARRPDPLGAAARLLAQGVVEGVVEGASAVEADPQARPVLRRRRARPPRGERGVPPQFAALADAPAQAVAAAALEAPRPVEPVEPAGQLFVVVNEAPDLKVEVKELSEEAPGQACATSAVQDVYGRITQKEVKVSSSDVEPEVVLTGPGGAPSQNELRGESDGS